MGYDIHGRTLHESAGFTIKDGSTSKNGMTVGPTPIVHDFSGAVTSAAAYNGRENRVQAVQHATDGWYCKINVLVPGWFRIHMNAYVIDMTTGKVLWFLFYKNGAAIANAVTKVSALTGKLDRDVHLERTVWLDAGDYVQLYVRGTGTSTTFAAQEMEFMVTPVG